MTALNAGITTRQAREDQAIYRAMHLLEKRLREPGEVFNGASGVRQFLVLNLAGVSLAGIGLLGEVDFPSKEVQPEMPKKKRKKARAKA